MVRCKLFIVLVCFCALCGARVCHAQQQSQEQLASQYFANGEYEQAIEIFESMYGRTSSKFYYQMLFRSYMALQQYKEAERLVDKRMRKDSKDLTLFVDQAQVAMAKGESKKAIKIYDAAIDKLGTDPNQLNELTMAFENVGRWDYAAKAYLQARKRLNSKFVYVMELASVYEHLGDYEGMMGEYFDLLDNAPGNMGSIQISLQRALNETSDSRMADGLRRTLIDRIQAHPDNRDYLEMMIWFSLQQKDFEFALTQAKAVDARFPDMGGEQLLRVANIALNNGDYEVAEQGFRVLVKKGPQDDNYYAGRVGALQAEFAQLNKNYPVPDAKLEKLRQSYQSAFDELGKGEKMVPIMRDYATLMAYYANDVQAAADILYDIIEMPRLKTALASEVKLELGDVMLFAGEVWEASLLYMQVEKANKNDVVGALAKFKNAKLSYYSNDFQWAKSQLDVLRSSTSKLIANDAMELSLLISDNMEEDSTYDMLEMYAAADLLLYRNQLEAAWVAFDAITHRALSHALFDEVLMQKAKIRMKQSRFEEADSLLQQLIEFYPSDILADDALFMRGQLNEEMLNRPERASECYEKLILDYPTSLYAEQSRKRYNKLKTQKRN